MTTFWRGTAPPRGPSRVARLRQSEKAWQAQVVTLAHLRGWEVYHTFDARRSAAGFPDLVLVRPPTVWFVEVKTDTGRVSPVQQSWLDVLALCDGVSVGVWRPAMWPEIDAYLA